MFVFVFYRLYRLKLTENNCTVSAWIYELITTVVSIRPYLLFVLVWSNPCLVSVYFLSTCPATVTCIYMCMHNNKKGMNKWKINTLKYQLNFVLMYSWLVCTANFICCFFFFFFFQVHITTTVGYACGYLIKTWCGFQKHLACVCISYMFLCSLLLTLYYCATSLSAQW